MEGLKILLQQYYYKLAPPSVGVIDILEILLISFFVYQFIVWIKYTRAYTLLKGILVVLAFLLAAYIFRMNTILWIAKNLATVMITAVLVVFQPELRKALEQLGQKNIMASIIPFDSSKDVQERFSDKTANEIVRACFDMGEVKTGALIVVEQDIRLTEYEKTGIMVDAQISSQLLINIFEHNTPLHDGAVIVKGNRITAATCYLPLSDNMELSKQLGTRHRAGVGISEVTDSLTIIVSEETGQVSVALNGKLRRNISSAQLRELLEQAQNKTLVESGKRLHHLWKGRIRINEKKITDNLPLKLMSVIVAVFIWLIVVNVDNPTMRKPFDVPVTVLNTDYVDGDGKMCLQEEGEEYTRVYVTGRRKTLERLRPSDITATADLRQAVSLDTTPVMVPITVSCKGVAAENLVAIPQNISIRLDEKQTQEYLVSVIAKEGKPGKGYELGTTTANPEKIRITGPASLMRKIDKVIASVNVSGKTEDITENVELKIVDKNQDEISESQMKYLKIDPSSSKVTVTADLWKVKSDIAIKADYSGYPAEGYKVGGLTLTPSTVSVTGSAEALAALEGQGNTIWIPAGAIDITGADSDCEIQVEDLTAYLPDRDNMRLAANTSNKVIAKVSVLPQGSEAYSILTKEIKKRNVPDKLEAAFETDKVEIRVYGTEEQLAVLGADDISVSIDLSDKKEGTYKVPLKVVLPEGCELVSEVSTEVTLSAIKEREESKNRGLTMERQKVTIKNPTGLHLRPAGILCKEAMKYKSLVTFSFRGNIANAKSVLSVLGACVKCGDEIELMCEGSDEEEAMASMTAIIQAGLGE